MTFAQSTLRVVADKVLHDFVIHGNPRPVTRPAQVVEILDLAW